MEKVFAIKDGGHWYVIPLDLKGEFISDLSDEEISDSGDFYEKYRQYMTGGDLNLVQLWANLKNN